jgi:predicted DNA-binding protein
VDAKRKSGRYAIRLEDGEKEMLRRTAEREERSAAQIVRRALAAYCAASLRRSTHRGAVA